MQSSIKKTKTKSKLSPNQDPGMTRYNKIFLLLFVIYQPLVIILTGFFIRSTPSQLQSLTQIDSAMINVTGSFILTIIGFGLYFSYLRNYNWSGIGFTLFITVTSFQFYFLINGMWTRSAVEDTPNVSFKSTIIDVYLNNQGYTNVATNTHEATVTGATKCALAVSIAFAAIGGRAGYLQAFIISIIGTFFQQLNAELVARYAVDYGGSMRVFLFGGSMGSIMAVILSCKQGDIFYSHRQYVSNKFSRTLTLIGTAFCWIFFPLFNMDISPQLFIYSHAGISTFICISASVTTMIGICLVVEQRIQLRCLITSVIAGGIIVGSSSTNIYSPLGALILGIVAAGLQYIFVRIEVELGEKPWISNGVLFLFVVHGFLGSLFSSVFRAINQTSGTFATLYNSLSSQFITDQGGQVAATFITLSMGAGTGLAVGFLLLLLNDQKKKNFYHDRSHWVIEDQALMDKWFDQPQKQLQLVQGSTANLHNHSYL